MRHSLATPVAALEPVRRVTRRTSPGEEVRTAAARAVERALASLAPVELHLEAVAARLDERDRGLLTEITLGTLRWLTRLDAVIERASNRPLLAIEPSLWAPLRVATYQLLFLDRVPAHAAVNEAVEHARRITHKGGVAFVNAVLRKIAKNPSLQDWPVAEADPVRRLAIEMAHPEFLVRRWLSQFGEVVTRELLKANNRPKPLHLLAFRDRGGRELAAEALLDEGLEVEPSRLSPLGLVMREGHPFQSECFRRGDLYVQDEASQLAAWLPPPRPGERVLDAAAAPGGKSLALLAMEPSLRIVAADIGWSRARLMASNLARLRRHLPVLVGDAARLPLSGSFDRVVLDLPCSGTGTLRKHPELKWRVSETEITRLSSLGARLLEGVAGRVAPGGKLVAITCSIEREENETVVGRFLEKHSDFDLVELDPQVGAASGVGGIAPGLWRLLPGGDHDGFTVHVLSRRG